MKDEYRNRIDRLIREMTGEVVLNGSPEHATIIVELMLANAVADVSILTRRFDPRIYGTDDTVAQSRLFLGDPKRTVEILIEDASDAALADHPFMMANRDAIERGNLKVRTLSPTDNVPFNFSVMDDRGYRFENDKSKPVATAAFGSNDGFPAKLRSVFGVLWRNALPAAVSA